jgi:hypothetical protein
MLFLPSILSRALRCAFIFASCACTFPLSGQTLPNYVPSDGLVAWYALNGSLANEAVSGALNGLSFNGQYITDRNGAGNSAAGLNGAHLIQLPLNSAILSNDFTLSFWVYKRTSLGHNPVQVAMPNGSGRVNFGFTSPQSDGAPYVSELTCAGTYGDCGYGSPTQATPFGQWFHLVYVVNYQNSKIYFNGGSIPLVMNCELNLDCQNESMSLWFGGDVGGGAIEYFDGDFDDIGIWNRALTAEEVMALYLGNPLVPGCTDPAACNFSAEANSDDGSCVEAGCTDPAACNFDPEAGCDDGSCAPAEAVPGCMEAAACNYDAAAVCTGPCVYPPAGSADCGAGAAFCGEGMVWDAAQQTCLIDPAYVAGIAAGAAQGACGPWTVWDAGAGQCVGAATPACASDLSGNGSIGIEDLLILLSEFAMMCP